MMLIDKGCISALAEIQENSVDLIVVDPPYLRVKSVAWGNQWDNENDFFEWCD